MSYVPYLDLQTCRAPAGEVPAPLHPAVNCGSSIPSTLKAQGTGGERNPALARLRPTISMGISGVGRMGKAQ